MYMLDSLLPETNSVDRFSSKNNQSLSTHLMHIRRLPFKVEPYQFESPNGYFCRLAQLYSYERSEWIERLPQSLFKDPYNGYDRKLAFILRLKFSEWMRMAYPVIVYSDLDSRVSFLGKEISLKHLNRTRPRACISCLRSLSVWWAVWDLTLVTACPFHATQFIDRCTSCGNTLTRSRSAVHFCRCGQDLRDIKPKRADRRLTMISAAIYRAAEIDHLPSGETFKQKGILPDLHNVSLNTVLDRVTWKGYQQYNHKKYPNVIQRKLSHLDVARKTCIWAVDAIIRNHRLTSLGKASMKSN